METLLAISRLTVTELEVIVVDDGSSPPVECAIDSQGMQRRVLRTAGVGRSSARNLGAANSRAPILFFVDDDMSLDRRCVEQHLLAHERWPGSIVTGSIVLPRVALEQPFGRFRQALEDSGVPASAGPVTEGIVCAAANISLLRTDFDAIGGFDPLLSSAEDQDLALRHTARGGGLVYWPAAAAVHRDDAIDLPSYCQRAEWGMENLIPFCRKHPDLPDNLARHRVNGPHLGGEPMGLALRKAVKHLLGTPVCVAGLFSLVRLSESLVPSKTRERMYRLMLGIHLQRGYRRGMARVLAE